MQTYYAKQQARSSSSSLITRIYNNIVKRAVNQPLRVTSVYKIRTSVIITRLFSETVIVEINQSLEMNKHKNKHKNKNKHKHKHKQVTRTPVDEYDIRGDMDMTSLLSSARMTSLLDGEQHQMHGDGRDEDSHIRRIETATTAGSSPSNSSVFAGLELERSNKSSPSSVGAGVRAGVGLNVSSSVSNRNDTHTRPHGHAHGHAHAHAHAHAHGYAYGHAHGHAHAHGPIDKRDGYVRSGTHFRTLLDNAMKKVAIGFSNTNTGEIEVALTNETDGGGTGTDVVGERSEYEHEHERRRKRRGGLESKAPRKRRLNEYGDIHDDNDNDDRQNSFYSGNNHKHASELAREKVAEVMSLKRVSGTHKIFTMICYVMSCHVLSTKYCIALRYIAFITLKLNIGIERGGRSFQGHVSRELGSSGCIYNIVCSACHTFGSVSKCSSDY